MTQPYTLLYAYSWDVIQKKIIEIQKKYGNEIIDNF